MASDVPIKIEIRRVAPSDAAVVARTIVKAFEQYRGRLKPESGAFDETPERIAKELRGDAAAYVATVDGGVVGCVMTRPAGDDLYFGRLSVDPAARGRSIGRRLVAAVEAEAARSRMSGVKLSVRIALPENQRFFAAIGYREISRERHPGFEEPTFLNMRKPLR
jgi:ribosomal protein S18 acetylase RimI-like enzyme